MRKFGAVTIASFIIVLCSVTPIFSVAQTLTTLYSFTGYTPATGLVQGTDGDFYGATAGNYAGAVFKISPEYPYPLTTLNTLPSYPTGPLVQGNDGNFYGTTGYYSGDYGLGMVFRIDPQPPYTVTSLYSFCSQPNCADGSGPAGRLVQGSDGNFYGTTYSGGSTTCGVENGCGTAFRLTLDGTLTTLHSFTGSDGQEPNGLALASDGNFYGTAQYGGANQLGTVFKMTPSGSLTLLYSFCPIQVGCPDGNTPYSGLVQGTDGNLYGTTAGLSRKGSVGTVFKITPSGTMTILHSFCSQPNCVDGLYPYAGLVQGTDGNFYGTTSDGGANGIGGTVFKMTPDGTLTTIYSFCSQLHCEDGNTPNDVVQGADGNIFGTTQQGGANNAGTVFQLSTGIVLSPLQFVPVTPCRLVDTRTNHGGAGPIQGGTYQFFNLPQAARQGENCPSLDLSTAAAFSLNVTVVPQGPLGYLTVWPAGRSRPLVSTMNSLDGRIKANAAIIPAGASQAVSIFASDTTDVILDIDGYFAPASSSTLAFYSLTPCRVADTRKSNFPDGLGQPHLSAGVPRDFPVPNSTCIPSGVNAAAYSFNFTAIPYPNYGDTLGYLEVWPTDNEPENPVSTLNNLTGTYVANAAIVPAGSGGNITAYASSDTDLAIDIDGYFAPAGTGGLSLYPTVPCRVIDTRKIGNGQPFSGTLSPPVEVVDSDCGIPTTAQGFVFNATVVPDGPLGYLTLWPDSEGQPLVSTLNATDGWITSNMAIVPNVNGEVDAYAAGLTQLVLDISSYFAP